MLQFSADTARATSLENELGPHRDTDRLFGNQRATEPTADYFLRVANVQNLVSLDTLARYYTRHKYAHSSHQYGIPTNRHGGDMSNAQVPSRIFAQVSSASLDGGTSDA